MPNNRSSAKRLRQSRKATIKNTGVKKAISFLTKQTRVTAKTSQEEALKLYRQAQKALDKAAQRGIVTKNTAARKKARLMKNIQKLVKK